MTEEEFQEAVVKLGVSPVMAGGLPAIERGNRAVSMFDPIPTFQRVLMVLLEKRGMFRRWKRVAYTREFDDAYNWLSWQPVSKAVSPEDDDPDRARAMIQMGMFNYRG